LNTYMALKYSVLTIQAIWRGRAVRRTIENKHRCTTLIQSFFRRHVLQSQFRSRKEALREKHWAAIVLQNAVRVFLCRRRYLLLQSAAIILPSRYRALLAGRSQRIVQGKSSKRAG
uniref:Myosin motor domain-containing protein n=1 Tax=Esox lucius TaxID=8010 RepID=A0AAY5K9C2_ESOLU